MSKTTNISLDEVKNIGHIELLARQMVEGFITGLHKSPYHGFSVEFAEHRLYNTGESTRHIDWKIFAKTDRLYTKRYEEETNLRCRLLLDVSGSMYYPAENNGKITFSLMSAACLAYMLHRQRDAVGLTTFSDDLVYKSDIKSTPGHMQQLYAYMQQILNRETGPKTTALPEVLHQIADSEKKRSLIILFSDMFGDPSQEDSLFSALRHLKHKKHEVLLFHTTDNKTELDFDFEDRPYEFIDAESGEKMKLHPYEIKALYKDEMTKYFHNLKLRCGQYKIDFIPANIYDGYEQVLRSYLIKRAKMT